MSVINKSSPDIIYLIFCIKYLLKWFCLSCVLLLLVIMVSTNAEAAQGSDEEALKDIERKQFEIEQKLREKERIKKEAEEKQPEKKIIPPEEAEYRFLIKEIEIQNPELLTGREKKRLLAPFLDKEMTYNDINILAGKITNILVGKGYITARVKVPLGEDLKSGKLILTIVNGYIEEIFPDKDSIRRKMQLFFAFPFFKGRLLNVNDLDYGVEQMNRLESNNVTMKISPGEALGGSRILISNDPGYMLNFETGVDNLGQKSTSLYRRKISAGLDNLISINDYTLFTYTDGTNTDTDRKFNRCYTFYFAVPLGYWTLSANYNYSAYRQQISGMNTEYKFEGNSSSSSYSIERLMWRKKLDRIKSKVSLTLKDKATFIQDEKIGTQSNKLTVAEIGLSYSSYLFSGFFSSGINYDRGLDLFNAKKDESGMDESVPRAQFNKYKLDIFWNRQFNIFNQSFAYSFNSSGQYGMETLYNTEQISIGDLYTVRGFKKSSAAGDRGYFIRNELSANDFSRFWRYLRGLKLFAAYDYGYVINKIGKEANNGQGEATLAAISSGFNYSARLFNVSFTYGRKLRSPRFIEEDKYVIYFIFTMNLTTLFEETRDLIFSREKNEEKYE
ncbi:MAG: ShlB/FhaC/HecB family hemolysin secretion/activation protein [Spirochaetes bacterium]|nr:ShlB/FhaC/HecB family hemolysin secretion/activation protein [Spirochaetota bacterium]